LLRSSPSFSTFWRAFSRSRAAPWILTWTAVVFAALAIASASGCARTVLVSEGSPVRIGPKATARVYALVAGEWELSENRVEIPEGWYLVPPSFVEKE
jgi:hypothetical protein